MSHTLPEYYLEKIKKLNKFDKHVIGFSKKLFWQYIIKKIKCNVYWLYKTNNNKHGTKRLRKKL